MVPRWLVRLLETVLPADRHDDLIGDLEELHRRRLGAPSGGRLRAHLATLFESALLLARFTVGRWLARAVGALRGVSAAELRLALRLVRKQPVMTATAVVALGVGIGIVAGAFSVFHQVLTSDLGWPGGERWVLLESRHAETRAREPMTLELLEALRAEAPALAYVGATRNGDFNVVLTAGPGSGPEAGSVSGEVERLTGTRLTPGTFRHLPYTPLLGRLLVPADGRPGAAPVALIRESFWERRFARSPEVLEAHLAVAGTEHRIVGVLPDEAGYPNEGELWLPLPETTLGATAHGDPIGTRLVGVLATAERPRTQARGPEPARERAQAQAQQLADRITATGRGLPRLSVQVRPLAEIPVDASLQTGIALVMGLFLAILLVIAGNVANLVVARTARRGPELAVRTADPAALSAALAGRSPFELVLRHDRSPVGLESHSLWLLPALPLRPGGRYAVLIRDGVTGPDGRAMVAPLLPTLMPSARVVEEKRTRPAHADRRIERGMGSPPVEI